MKRLLVFLSFSILLIWAEPVSAETISIGVPQIPADLNILDSSHPAAKLVRSAVTGKLTRKIKEESAQDPKFRMSLSDNFRVNSEFSEWSFRIPKGRKFSNGMPIGLQDVEYSIRRCKQLNSLIQDISKRSLQVASGNSEDWIVLKTAENASKKVHSLPSRLAECPIIEKRTAVLFGEELGKGSNVVSTGAYAIFRFSEGKSITMRRVDASKVGRGGVEELLVRGFKEPSHGLTALRMGTIDALFTRDGDVITRANDDETLFVSSCWDYSLAARNGLVFDCQPELVSREVGYRS